MTPSDKITARDVFFEVHRELPREGPGNTESTLRALDLAGELAEAPVVLDIGCGPGMQTLDLARALPAARFAAVDLHPRFLGAARRRLVSAGAADRILVAAADMTALPFPDARFDLLWCEGAAYIMGFADALKGWRRLLRPHGRLALTEPVWLTENPPVALARWWQKAYRAMRTAAERRAEASSLGYRVLGDFVLPEEAWWVHYYTPMTRRLELLEARYRDNPTARGVLREMREEIQNYRDHSDAYGYQFLVLAAEGDVNRSDGP